MLAESEREGDLGERQMCVLLEDPAGEFKTTLVEQRLKGLVFLRKPATQGATRYAQLARNAVLVEGSFLQAGENRQSRAFTHGQSAVLPHKLGCEMLDDAWRTGRSELQRLGKKIRGKAYGVVAVRVDNAGAGDARKVDRQVAARRFDFHHRMAPGVRRRGANQLGVETKHIHGVFVTRPDTGIDNFVAKLAVFALNPQAQPACILHQGKVVGSPLERAAEFPHAKHSLAEIMGQGRHFCTQASAPGKRGRAALLSNVFSQADVATEFNPLRVLFEHGFNSIERIESLPLHTGVASNKRGVPVLERCDVELCCAHLAVLM